MVTAFDYIAGITFRIGLRLGYIKRRGHLQRFQKAADVLINWTWFKKLNLHSGLLTYYMKRFSWTIGLQTAARNQYPIITKWYEHLVCGAHGTRRLHERYAVSRLLRNS